MRYILCAFALAVVLANVAGPAPTTQQIAPAAPERAWTAVSCDENDQAFDVEPDTPAAWREAQEWCIRSGKAIEDLPWPDGIEPTTFPRAGS